MPRWDDEELSWVQPDKNKIQCSKCMLREKDRLDGEIDGATLGVCEAFQFKPTEILFNGAECPYFIDENTPDDEEE